MPALLALDISDSGSNSSHGRFLKFLKWKKQLLHMELSHRLQTTAASCQCQQDSAAVIIGLISWKLSDAWHSGQRQWARRELPQSKNPTAGAENETNAEASEEVHMRASESVDCRRV